MSRVRPDEDAADDSDDDYSRMAKRQRLSSPTYDDQFELSQDQVAAFDAFERELSQATAVLPLSQMKPSQTITDSARKRRNSAIALALSQSNVEFNSSQDDTTRRPLLADTTSIRPDTKPISQPRSYGFQSAKHITSASQSNMTTHPPSSSPDIVADPDMSDWFQSTDAHSSGLMFKPVKDMSAYEREDDAFLDEWFNAPAPTGSVSFQSAKILGLETNAQASASKEPVPLFAGFVSGARLQSQTATSRGQGSSAPASSSQEPAPSFVGFTSGAALVDPSAKKNSWTAPSAAALAAAAARMKQWQREIESGVNMIVDMDNKGDFFDSCAGADADSPLKQRSNARQPVMSLPSFGNPRNVLSALENSNAFTPASQHAEASMDSRLLDTPTPAARSFRVPSLNDSVQRGAKAFKSPLLPKPASTGSPLDPKSRFSSPSGFVTPSRKPMGFTTPSRTTSEPGLSSSFVAPSPIGSRSALATDAFSTSTGNKSLGVTPRRGTQRAFVTPFKPGFRPGEPGRALLDAQTRASPSLGVASVTMPGPASRDRGKGRERYFDLTKPQDRQTLESCGLRPQKYTTEELERMGINAAELNQMTPDLALYYTFHTSSVSPIFVSSQRPPPPTRMTLGPKAALDELKHLGCSLATKQWVDNHWGLILWKLAGMVCLDPDAESEPARKRWCWREVMNQLRYRYEREINRGQRPVLRKIVAQDIAASVPMVLCVSNITWSEDSVGDNGTPLPPIPELEVTDGWYRLNAEIDDPLERAIRKGKIHVGSKIAVVGCRIHCERKEFGEILEIGKSVSLQIHGNSSQLAPWHAKLGFQKTRFLSTLGSLDPYGGLVSAIELVLIKAYPIAFLEFFVTDDGRKHQEGPWDEKEETRLSDKWEAKRDIEATKLREEYGDKLHRFAEYAEQLERKAAPVFHPTEDDSPPDNIDDLLLELEDAEDGRSIIRRITAVEAGWLALAVRDKCRRDEELNAGYIERDLNSTCPPRNVRSFRIIVARDARSHKWPAQREVQITVWDVLSVRLEEDGKPGDFRIGQHFMVTNLWPCKPGCWMSPRDAQSEAYLNSRKESTWTLLGSGCKIP